MSLGIGLSRLARAAARVSAFPCGWFSRGGRVGYDSPCPELKGRLSGCRFIIGMTRPGVLFFPWWLLTMDCSQWATSRGVAQVQVSALG